MSESNTLAKGLHARLIDARLRQALGALETPLRAQIGDVGRDLTRELTTHLSTRIAARLHALTHEPARMLELCNRLLEVLGEEGGELEGPPAQLLEGVLEEDERRLTLPIAPLSANDLITNAGDSHGLISVLRSEIPSASSIELICAFIKWTGFRLIQDELELHVRQGKRLRVLTTTYMGATDRRAVEALESIGAEVRVCYEHDATRLHAKAWLFERPQRATTAIVGSSNMSYSALTDGMEWNVRLSERRAPDVVARFREVFEGYWDDPVFEDFDEERFAEFLDFVGRPGSHRVRGTEGDEARTFRPFPYQEAILERLNTQRVRHDRHENLVVAATGVGKTVIAAFDFARLREAHPGWTLLFVAHRKDILEQSLRTFRAVLGDSQLGELMVDGERPMEWECVFASVQSLTRGDALERLDPDHFDVVIVDECHHSAAASYVEVLEALEPRELLGLTATPERMDGQSILGWFGGRIAAEMRLWDALAQHLLVPFHYFAFDDGTDLRDLTFTRGRYARSDLERVYTANDARARLVQRQLERLTDDTASMRALGFCASIEHAEFMARFFCEQGYRAIALSSTSSDEDRDATPGRLASGELQLVFTVDLYNEGVDIPSVDTLLMLRPTESATVFLQQLGRGLRRSEGKACVTVLDFVGHMHERFDLSGRFATLTGMTRKGLKRALEGDGMRLPSGCVVELDRVTTERVLEHVQSSLGTSLGAVTRELKAAGDVSLEGFLEQTGYGVEDVYRTGSWWWTKLRLRAGLPVGFEESAYERALKSALGSRVHRLVHLDDSERLELYLDVLSAPSAPELPEGAYARAMLTMLVNQLWGSRPDGPGGLHEALAEVWSAPGVRGELLELFALLSARAEHVTQPLREVRREWPRDAPISLHGTYSRDEVLTALGHVALGEQSGHREGVWRDRDLKLEVLFVTLEKDPDRFAPSVRYHDYPMGLRRFHWQTQTATGPHTDVGKQYIDHVRLGWTIVLFVRQADRDSRNLKNAPFRCLGPVTYVRHEGSQPMSIVWELDHAMPSDVFMETRAAGA